MCCLKACLKFLKVVLTRGPLYNLLLTKLKRKAEIIGIELRMVDRFYPSSKICHSCGHIHKGLKLKDRIFICPKCGYTEDRDFNASLNLRDAKKYRVA